MDILSIIFPRKCISCQTMLSVGGDKWLCGGCRKYFAYVNEKSEYLCDICGRPIEHKGKCVFCNTQKIYYDSGSCLYEYKDGVRDALLRFKLGGRADYAAFFGKNAADNIDIDIKNDYDAVTAVPMYKTDERKRGYNQSVLLAKQIAKITGIKYEPLLEKTVKTKPQRTLKKAERIKNVKNAFSVCSDVKGKKILIIDDVITTGSTLNECCRVLKKAGAERTDFFALCTRELNNK